MTRKSKRELERAVDDLALDGDDDGPGPGPGVVYDTGDEYLYMDGEPVPTDDDGDLPPPEWGAWVIFEGDPREGQP
jgi:hypothetical protein